MLKKLETFEPRPGIAYFLITCATFLWGLSIVIGRGVHQEIPPLGLSFWRWFVGAVFLLPFVCAELIRKAEIIRRHTKFIIFMGIIQIGSSVMLMVGVNFTTAINASVINAVQPAVTAVAAWILTKDKLTQGQSAGIVAGFAGILVIVAKADIAHFACDCVVQIQAHAELGRSQAALGRAEEAEAAFRTAIDVAARNKLPFLEVSAMCLLDLSIMCAISIVVFARVVILTAAFLCICAVLICHADVCSPGSDRAHP